MPRILGLDVGDIRIGIAMCDEDMILSSSMEVYTRINKIKDKDKIKGIIEKHKISEIVVGIPRNMDGSIGHQAKKVLTFIKNIETIPDVVVIPWDERLTTKISHRVLIEGNVKRKKRKQVVDKLAAQLILQGYLDYMANQAASS